MIKVIELFVGVGCQREALKRANIEYEVVTMASDDYEWIVDFRGYELY